MIDGPTLFDTLMAGSTMLFAGTTIWFARARNEALFALDVAEYNDAQATAAYEIEHSCYLAAEAARKTAIATHEAYLAAEPERQAAHLKAYFSRIGKQGAVKGNQSPKRRKAEG